MGRKKRQVTYFFKGTIGFSKNPLSNHFQHQIWSLEEEGQEEEENVKKSQKDRPVICMLSKTSF